MAVAAPSKNTAAGARDIKALEGYKVEQVVPFDMFPHTKHVESVAMLTLYN